MIWKSNARNEKKVASLFQVYLQKCFAMIKCNGGGDDANVIVSGNSATINRHNIYTRYIITNLSYHHSSRTNKTAKVAI